MSDKRSGQTDKKQSSPGKIVLIGAVATALAIFNMSTGSEAPSHAVMILQYGLLACGVIGLGGGLFMMANKS